MIKIAINGFGRIGKTFLRTLLEDKNALKEIDIIAINIGKGEPEAAVFAFKYDTLMGTYPANVEYKNNKMYIDDYEIDIIVELDPENLPWKNYEIDWVVESSGHFTKREGAEKHLKAGAKSVLITAPAKGEDITIIPGVNSNLFDQNIHKIVSLGSCTTNALAPMIKVLDDEYSIKTAFMTTVHAYTNTQALLDLNPSLKDLRKRRAAAVNIIPSTTGASDVVDKIFPHLKNKIKCSSLRVPVPKVSLIDLTVVLNQNVETKQINDLFLKKALSDLKNILDITNDPLVSSDYNCNNYSVVIDGPLTEAQDNVAKVFGWYDNEWAYSMRLKDFLKSIY